MAPSTWPLTLDVLTISPAVAPDTQIGVALARPDRIRGQGWILDTPLYYPAAITAPVAELIATADYEAGTRYVVWWRGVRGLLFTKLAVAEVLSELDVVPVAGNVTTLGGARLLDLSDTPATYAGRAGQALVVSPDETGTELRPVATAADVAGVAEALNAVRATAEDAKTEADQVPGLTARVAATENTLRQVTADTEANTGAIAGANQAIAQLRADLAALETGEAGDLTAIINRISALERAVQALEAQAGGGGGVADGATILGAGTDASPWRVAVPFTADDDTKLSEIEARATRDQTPTEIRQAVEDAADSNVFTDADATRLRDLVDRTVLAEAPSADTVGKWALRDDGTSFGTHHIEHQAIPNRFTPGDYASPTYKGVFSATPDAAGYAVGDWHVNLFSFNPRIVVMRSGAHDWDTTSYQALGLDYIGQFPRGDVAEVAPHASANGQVYLDVDDSILRTVTRFIPGRQAEPDEYAEVGTATHQQIERLTEDITSEAASRTAADQELAERIDAIPEPPDIGPVAQAAAAAVAAAAAAQLDTDTVIGIGPNFVHNAQGATVLGVSIRHPPNAYGGANILEVRPGGQLAVRVAYDPTEFHQMTLAEVPAKSVENIWDATDDIPDGQGGARSVQRYGIGSYIPVEIRLVGPPPQGQEPVVHFFRVVDVLVVAPTDAGLPRDAVEALIAAAIGDYRPALASTRIGGMSTSQLVPNQPLALSAAFTAVPMRASQRLPDGVAYDAQTGRLTLPVGTWMMVGQVLIDATEDRGGSSSELALFADPEGPGPKVRIAATGELGYRAVDVPIQVSAVQRVTDLGGGNDTLVVTMEAMSTEGNATATGAWLDLVRLA